MNCHMGIFVKKIIVHGHPIVLPRVVGQPSAVDQFNHHRE
jgi:hypothetical protein